jgi:hypothetical protein
VSPRSESQMERETFRAEQEAAEWESTGRLSDEGDYDADAAAEIVEGYDPLIHRDPGFEYDDRDPDDTRYEREWAAERRQYP